MVAVSTRRSFIFHLSCDAENGLHEKAGGEVNYAALLRSAVVALMRNKMRSVLTVLGITIGIAAVICVVAIGKAGQARVERRDSQLAARGIDQRKDPDPDHAI